MSVLSREYAEALFALALEKDATQEYMLCLDTLSECFKEYPEFYQLLASPALPFEDRRDAFLAVYESSLPEYVCSFVLLLCQKGRMSEFSDCVSDYRKLLMASKRITRVKVTSARELTEAEKARLINKLEKTTASTVQAEYFTDPAILGGVILEYDGRVMDGSLIHRLQEVKDVIGQ